MKLLTVAADDRGGHGDHDQHEAEVVQPRHLPGPRPRPRLPASLGPGLQLAGLELEDTVRGERGRQGARQYRAEGRPWGTLGDEGVKDKDLIRVLLVQFQWDSPYSQKMKFPRQFV